MRNRRFSQHEEGFTLFLLTFLLVIAAMAAATVLQQDNRDTFWQPRTETQEDIDKVVGALEAYQRENGMLPCVAPRGAAQGAATHGVALDDTNCTAAATGDTTRVSIGGVWVRIGTVPYKDLQLQDATQEDAWGNKLLYAVTERLTDTALYMNQTGALRVDDASGTVTAAAAFVVLSHGPDGIGAYRNSTGELYTACSASAGLAQENCDNDGISRQNSMNMTTGASYYDDLIEWKLVDDAAQAGE